MIDLFYAGLRKRVGAVIIDFIIIYILNITFIACFCTLFKIPPPPPSVTNPAGIIILGTIFFATSWLYFALTESSKKQASIGKRIIGIIVTDLQGNRIPFYKASLRFWGKFFVFPGFSLIGLIAKNRTLHDIMAGTFVVNKIMLSSDLKMSMAKTISPTRS